MRLLIVDDEPPALAKLRRLLAPMAEISWLGEAGNAEQALALLARERIDAVLLDIQMPGFSGLELALQLPAGVACAFSTAYDAHALRAFDLNAVDYLLKPYTPERLAETVRRLRQRLATPPAGLARGGLLGALRQLQPLDGHWLVEQARGGLLKLPLAQLQWVAAADNYIELHAPPACYLERRSLADFLQHPAATAFLRIHRSHAVNPAHIQALRALPHGEAMLTLSGGQQLRVSRSYRKQLAPG
ncbi:LytR/AlgR family response regulator transcription factor [Paucibacter sp. XJ19-41]|uniref:LytR/AlgR family response regulator transcription factor n=1 Tax=Paucibacter sp. XJ19-41 TaxID=2927824 RepID=UPI00234B3011|nr:response regulator [Paucibacter sp. XJ19-41]MDC6167389.1 response regulator [Paucibacter sp. XJ19-41]